jgi:hypothetical protein
MRMKNYGKRRWPASSGRASFAWESPKFLCLQTVGFQRPLFKRPQKFSQNAAVNSKTDGLRGSKENIIMGRLIPAGTGLPSYKRWKVVVEEQEEEVATSLPGLGMAPSQPQPQ